MTGPSSERTADGLMYGYARRHMSPDEWADYMVREYNALAQRHEDSLARNQQLQEALARLVIYADNAEQKMRREYRAAGETYTDEDWPKTEMESWAEGEALQDVLAEARAALASVRARTP